MGDEYEELGPAQGSTPPPDTGAATPGGAAAPPEPPPPPPPESIQKVPGRDDRTELESEKGNDLNSICSININ
ncbi:unnamed protein product [Anisakis simplex]|uniref:Sorting_nexin domain-containing protein n=1 Tax=Anisakis simplex TaxID=6269 RepID=A0A0M3KGP0_ANISI|nr:unnamed protein product [Anisakis simplex]